MHEVTKKTTIGGYVDENAEKKNITVRVPADLHAVIEEKVWKADTSFQAILLDALKRWLKDREETRGNPERSLADLALSDEEMGYVSRLLLILRSNHADFISAIKHTIDGLAGVVGTGRKARKD